MLRDDTSAMMAGQGKLKSSDAPSRPSTAPAVRLRRFLGSRPSKPAQGDSRGNLGAYEAHKAAREKSWVATAEAAADYILINEHKSVASQKRAILAARVARSRGMAQWLLGRATVEPAAGDRGRKQAECGAWLWFRDYLNKPLEAPKLSKGFFCQQPLLCEFCAARRTTRSLARAIPRVIAVLEEHPNLRPFLLTLTAKNQQTLAASFRQVMDNWGKALEQRRNASKGIRRKASAFDPLVGGLMSGEVKRGRDSDQWHFHTHAVVLLDRSFIGNADYFRRVARWEGDTKGRAEGQLADAWSELLGYKANLDLRPLYSACLLESGTPPSGLGEALPKELLEVYKYAMKFSDLTHEDRWTAAQELFGRRLLRGWGLLYGCKEAAAGADDLTGESGPYIETLYQFWEGTYRLHSSTGGEHDTEGE